LGGEKGGIKRGTHHFPDRVKFKGVARYFFRGAIVEKRKMTG